MKQLIITGAIIIVLLLTTSGIVVGRNLYKKSKDAERLDYEYASSNTPDLTVGRIVDIVQGKDTNPVLLEVTERIINPTDSTFKIDNINLRLLTPKSQKIIVKQKGGLSAPFTIHPNHKDNLLTLKFLLNPAGVKTLVRENGGGEAIAANRITSKDWGITFLLRGTITVHGYDIELDEKITL